MSHLCAHAAPLAVNRAVGKLNQIQGVVDERLQFVKRCVRVPMRLILKLTCDAAAHHRKRLGADLLRKPEILIKSQSI